MRCVVVGAGGFIGSAIARDLVSRGHEVAVVRRPASRPGRLDGLPVQAIHVADDVDPMVAAGALTDFGADVLFNLGWGGVANFARNDESQFDNITRTHRWAVAAREAGVGHVIGVGSQAEYGPTEGLVDETVPLLPTTLYGVAKSAAGLATRAALLGSDTAFTWVRIFSVYGPGDEPHWMVQAIGAMLLSGEAAELTPGTQLWDYLYIDDAARAFVAMAESKKGLGFVNLGSGSVTTVRRIVEQMKEISGSDSELSFGAVPFRPDQVMHLEADITKLTRETGWRPQVSLGEGLGTTMEYLRAAGAKA